MRAGVTVMDPATTWVDADVVLDPDVTLLPGTQLLGATHGRRRRRDRARTTPQGRESAPAPGSTARRASESTVGADATSGRSPTCAPARCSATGGKIGTFVETKNAESATARKVPHLSYVGDAEIGARHQHRRRHDLRQLRRGGQAPHHGRRARPDRRQQHLRRPGRRSATGRIHGGGVRSYRRTCRRARSRSPADQRPERGDGWAQRRARPDAGAADAAVPGARGRRLRNDLTESAPDDRGLVVGLKRTPKKHLMVFSGRAHPHLADEVAELHRPALVPTRRSSSPTPRSTSASTSRSAAATPS